MFWGNMTLSHWPCFTWKFFMIWFHKILKLIFQMLPSCPRNICTEQWKKLLNLTAFLEICLYLKNNDSVEHVQKVLLIVLLIYFQGKKSSHTASGRSGRFLFWFSSAILVPKMKQLFFSLWTSLCICHFRKHKSVFFQILD